MRTGIGREHEAAHQGLCGAVALLPGEGLQVDAVVVGVRLGDGADVLQGAGVLGVIAHVAEQERAGGDDPTPGEDEEGCGLMASPVGAGV
jgi:hypothetical protein